MKPDIKSLILVEDTDGMTLLSGSQRLAVLTALGAIEADVCLVDRPVLSMPPQLSDASVVRHYYHKPIVICTPEERQFAFNAFKQLEDKQKRKAERKLQDRIHSYMNSFSDQQVSLLLEIMEGQLSQEKDKIESLKIFRDNELERLATFFELVPSNKQGMDWARLAREILIERRRSKYATGN